MPPLQSSARGACPSPFAPFQPPLRPIIWRQTIENTMRLFSARLKSLSDKSGDRNVAYCELLIHYYVRLV